MNRSAEVFSSYLACTVTVHFIGGSTRGERGNICASRGNSRVDRSAGCNTGDGLVPGSGLLLFESVNMIMILDEFFKNSDNGRDRDQ